MNSSKLVSLPLALSLAFGTAVAPTLAEPGTTVTQQVRQGNTVIPAQSAVVVSFPQQLQVDAGQNQELPIPLVLIQPIYDQYGNEVVPANSVVKAKVVTGNEQAQIIVESLIIRGRVVPARAVSSPLSATTVTVSSSRDEARRYGAELTSFVGSVMGVLGADSQTIMQGGYGGNVLGMLIGRSSPKEVSVVGIPQGSTHVLTLQEAVRY